LYFVSATVNPILYNVMSRKYRQSFKTTLCYRCQDGEARQRLRRSEFGATVAFVSPNLPAAIPPPRPNVGGVRTHIATTAASCRFQTSGGGDLRTGTRTMNSGKTSTRSTIFTPLSSRAKPDAGDRSTSNGMAMELVGRDDDPLPKRTPKSTYRGQALTTYVELVNLDSACDPDVVHDDRASEHRKSTSSDRTDPSMTLTQPKVGLVDSVDNSASAACKQTYTPPCSRSRPSLSIGDKNRRIGRTVSTGNAERLSTINSDSDDNPELDETRLSGPVRRRATTAVDSQRPSTCASNSPSALSSNGKGDDVLRRPVARCDSTTVA